MLTFARLPGAVVYAAGVETVLVIIPTRDRGGFAVPRRTSCLRGWCHSGIPAGSGLRLREAETACGTYGWLNRAGCLNHASPLVRASTELPLVTQSGANEHRTPANRRSWRARTSTSHRRDGAAAMRSRPPDIRSR
jgi:hypothetical protein